MTRAGVLLGVAAVLAAALAWQNWPVPAVPRSAAPAETPAAAPQAPPGPQPAPLSGLALHPLFSPSRQAPLPQAPAPEAPPVAAPEAAPPAEPVLQGLILTPHPGAAYLALGDAPAEFLRPGDEAFGLTLLEILPDRARFRGPDGEVTLPLSIPPREPPPPETPAPETPAPEIPDAAPPDPAPAAPADANPAGVLSPDAFAPVLEDP